MGNNGKQEDRVLATVTGFLDSVSDKPTPLTETHKYVLPSAYAVDWRAHAGELIQTPRNAYVAEMERRLDRMRDADLSSFVQAMATTDTDLPPPRVWVDAGQGIAAVWAGFVMKPNGEEKYRGVGAFTLYHQQQTEEEESGGGGGGGGWKIAALVDALWDPEVSEAAVRDAVLPDCITHRLDNKSGLQSVLLQDILLLADDDGPRITGQQQQRRKSDVLDGDGRAVAGVGFLWMHYTVVRTQEEEAGAEQTATRGTASLTFLQRNGKWLVSGVQEAERLPS
ncbi:hypothetical protein PG994_011899 [Apiospora phragmitis]|uniref:SnoaL-like domain-containing protein n=1 Tax=Apiospora phragmitis TaxID=2905665 RepID=A0ABR1TU35_9PEZI